MIKVKTQSEAEIFEFREDIDVKFSDIETGDILTVKVNHIGVGDTTVAFYSKERGFLTPFKGAF